MLELIKEIDKAWSNKTILAGINPKKCIGYFDFRNRVIDSTKETDAIEQLQFEIEVA